MCKNCQDVSDKHVSDFISTLLIKDNSELSPEMQERFRKLSYEVVEKPTIFLGTGTCGLGAGAGKSLKVIK